MTNPPEDDRGGFESDTERPCMECGQPAYRVDICFEANLHHDCAPEADRKYWEAVEATPWGGAILNAVFRDAEDDERQRFKEKLKSINFGRVPGGAR
jgi:hypothetical protein